DVEDYGVSGHGGRRGGGKDSRAEAAIDNGEVKTSALYAMTTANGSASLTLWPSAIHPGLYPSTEYLQRRVSVGIQIHSAFMA
ncbi:hypothetical protein WG66_002186, partial [Moniliophthora roreri]